MISTILILDLSFIQDIYRYIKVIIFQENIKEASIIFLGGGGEILERMFAFDFLQEIG